MFDTPLIRYTLYDCGPSPLLLVTYHVIVDVSPSAAKEAPCVGYVISSVVGVAERTTLLQHTKGTNPAATVLKTLVRNIMYFEA